MSFFNVNWIILKIIHHQNSSIELLLLTNDYWKIRVFTKQNSKKNIDLWNIINTEIKVWKTNEIKNFSNIKILSQLDYTKLDFETTMEYLILINLVEKNIPLNLKFAWLYEIISKINNYKTISEEKIIFSQLKILNILWLLWINSKNKEINKILNFIHISSIDTILKLKDLNINTKMEIKEIILKNNNS